MRFLLLFLLLAAAAHASWQHGAHLRIHAETHEAAQAIAEQLGVELLERLPTGQWIATDADVSHPAVARIVPRDFDARFWSFRPTPPITHLDALRDVDPEWNLHALHVRDAWPVTNGSGSLVMVIDAGASLANPDLVRADHTLAWDAIRQSGDVEPPAGIDHGTSTTAMVAAPANNFCGTGTAPGATLSVIRLLGPRGVLTTSAEAAALLHLPSGRTPDVLSLSIGPSDTGFIYAPLDDALLTAFDTLEARGTTVAWSIGNGRLNDDHALWDGAVSHPGVLAVAAVGHDGLPAYYTEPGGMAALAAPSSDHVQGVSAAVGSNGCNAFFGGTSAAAPQIAGILALLATNRSLTIDDRYDALFQSANANRGAVAATVPFTANAAGMLHSVDVGFGIPDAADALARANHRSERWVARTVSVPLDAERSFLRSAVLTANVTEDATVVAATARLGFEFGPYSMAQMTEISITSPSGTVAVVLGGRNRMYGMRSVHDLRLGTRAFHREPARGVWSVTVRSMSPLSIGLDAGMLLDLRVVM